ncbi:MAG TPA: histidine kinase dimerization/phospho-acceptor domain-containing protein [Anaerolineales bacterium]
MNEGNSPDMKSNANSEEWKSWPPEIFLANLLHELRTPVMIIKGYTKFLATEMTTENYPEALDSISKAVERLEHVCQRIADYRRELDH